MENEVNFVVTNRENVTEKKHEIEVRKSRKVREDGSAIYFFSCGDEVGYVPTKTAKAIIDGELGDDDLFIGDVSINGGKPVKCLMKKGSEALATLNRKQ